MGKDMLGAACDIVRSLVVRDRIFASRMRILSMISAYLEGYASDMVAFLMNRKG